MSTKDMIGVWPFHDHGPHAMSSIPRGLFGGLIVRKGKHKKPKIAEPFDLRELLGKVHKAQRRPVRVDALNQAARWQHKGVLEWLEEFTMGEIVRPPKEEVIEAPIFFHHLADPTGKPIFDSGDIEEAGGTYSNTFDDPGDFDYFCLFHPAMEGVVTVDPAAPDVDVTVTIEDANPAMGFPEMGFYPAAITVKQGRQVTWINNSSEHHTVTARLGATQPTHAVNGRAFVGNTPTIVCHAGQKIRWTVFNLDLGHNWHNFHMHASRWTFAGEQIDVRSIGPAESFTFETVAPDPFPLDRLSPSLREKIEKLQKTKLKPHGAIKRIVKGDFLFHCHVHHHFMQGMGGLVRSRKTLWLSRALIAAIKAERGILFDNGLNNCPMVDAERCKKHGEGYWEDVPELPGVTMMHSALLPNTSKVLFFGYDYSLPSDAAGKTVYSRLWHPDSGYEDTANQPADVTPGSDPSDPDDFRKWSLWSGEHTFLDDAAGTLLVHGGYRDDLRKSYLFDPSGEQWAWTDKTDHTRFYSTTLTLADGRAVTLFGGSTNSIEAYEPGVGWNVGPIAVPPGMQTHRSYPWTYLLPDGKLFIAGPHTPTHRFDWTDPTATAETFSANHVDRSSSGEKGTAVMLTLRPPEYKARVVIMGGNMNNTGRSAQWIDLSDPAPVWTDLPDMNFERIFQFTATLLPDGRVMIAGGISGVGGAAEIFDPKDPTAGWQAAPAMARVRGYHSSLIMLHDGTVLAGGDPKAGGVPTLHERYYPGYTSRPRPEITTAPATTSYGATFDVVTPQATIISEVIVMRPGAATHGFNMSQRAIECEITGGDATQITVKAPPDGNIAPPGHYLLFLIDANRVPSIGHWIRIN